LWLSAVKLNLGGCVALVATCIVGYRGGLGGIWSLLGGV
jgi:hypothetical protein